MATNNNVSFIIFVAAPFSEARLMIYYDCICTRCLLYVSYLSFVAETQ